MKTTTDRKPTTTDGGIPVPSDEYSLTVGPDGPILLQDTYLLEQMANFNRERIAERQPHAKGAGAFGHFDVTNDVSAYTKATVFQPGTQEQADRLAGQDADYHRRDLFDAIKRGEYPTWTLKVQIMPFEQAKTYRFNPFDLTKVWPQGDYPLHEVGRLALTRNPTDFHTEIEQAAFEPNNMVAGIGPSPDKMLLARLFSYADAHRARLGVNYKQIPVNAPKCPFHSYSKDGQMRVQNVSDPVYAPNSKGGPAADAQHFPYVEKWEANGEFIHAAYTRRKDDDDWGQAGTLVRKVMDDAARSRLVSNVVGHLKKGVSAPVLARALEYWRNIDREVGDRIARDVTAQEVMSSRAVRGVGTKQKRSEATIDTFRNNAVGVKKQIR